MASATQDADEKARAKASRTAIDKSLADPVSEVWSIGLSQDNFRITPGDGSGDVRSDPANAKLRWEE